MAYFELGGEYEDLERRGRRVTVGYFQNKLVYTTENCAIAIIGDPVYEKRYARVEEYSNVPEDWS